MGRIGHFILTHHMSTFSDFLYGMGGYDFFFFFKSFVHFVILF